MSRARTLLTGMSTLALVVAFSTPGFAAKSVIADEEMDQVTAAGEPKIAMVTDSSASEGDVYSKNEQLNWFAGTLEEGSQNELKAITLNNVFGENQVATGVNIQAADSGMADGSSQDNNILQSWGSAKAFNGNSVDGVASYGDNNNSTNQALSNEQKQKMDGVKIVASDQNLDNVQNNDNTNSQVQNHAAVQGRLSVLWAFADEIASVENSNGANVYATNYVDTSITGVIEGGAQSSISALTVNNVFGLNQVANALNVASGNIAFNPLDVGAATGASASSQTNTIQQYRGAPAGWNSAPVFSN